MKVKRAKIDELMNAVPEMPAGFRDYATKEILKRNRYLFFKKVKTKTIAVCSTCGEKVELKKAAHNEKATCPNCKTKGIAKAINKAKQFEYSEVISIAQKIKSKSADGIVIRYVKVQIRFKHYEDTSQFPDFVLNSLTNPIIGMWEGSRVIRLIDPDDSNAVKKYYFEFEYSPKNNQWQWINEKTRSWCFQRELLRDALTIMYKRNLKQVIKNTPYKYCAIDYYKNDLCNIDDYFSEYDGHKELEYIVKCGMHNFARELVSTWMYANPYYDLKDLSKENLKRVKKLDLNYRGIKTLLWCQESNLKLSDVQLKQVIGYGNLQNMNPLLELMPINKIINHIEKQQCDKDIAAGLWVDYINMSRKLGKDVSKSAVLFPKDIKASHDEAVYLVAEKENAEVESKLKEVFEKWSDILEFESGKLKLIVPRSQKEFIKEGKDLKICVWSSGYAKRMADEKTLVLMIRKDNKPYFTLEIDTELVKVKQLHGYDHARAPIEVQRFVDKWQRIAKGRYLKSRLLNMNKGDAYEQRIAN